MMYRTLLFTALSLTLIACGDANQYPFFMPPGDTGDVGVTSDGVSDDVSGSDSSGGDVDGGADTGGPGRCLDSTECDDAQVCFEGGCEPACESDDDCRGDAPLCYREASVCVECTSSTSCAADELCVGFVCLAICDDNDDCADGEECRESTCSPLEPICDPGETLCEGDELLTCAEDGLSLEAIACPGGEECVEDDDGTARCVSRACEPFQRGCFGASSAWRCADDGSARIEIPCDDHEECRAGGCVPREVEICLEADTDSLSFATALRGSDTRGVSFSLCGAAVTATVESVTLLGDTEGVFELTERPVMPAIVTLGDHMMIEVRFEPEVAGTFTADLRVQIAEAADIVVPLRGVATDDEPSDCPVAIVACRPAPSDLPFEPSILVPVDGRVECEAIDSYARDASIRDYLWSIEERPPASVTAPVPVGSGDYAEMLIDAPGRYVVGLEVVDTNGVVSCEPGSAVIEGEDEAGAADLQVRLTWDSYADLDNHLLHESGTWNDSVWDCYSGNMETEWGAVLDMDDTNGFGPEIIELTGPQEGITYRIGVYLYAANSAIETNATIQISSGGVPMMELVGLLTTTGQFWDVAAVTFEGGEVEVTPIDVIHDGMPGS